jgi:predicted PurR-regulated permease PerM
LAVVAVIIFFSQVWHVLIPFFLGLVLAYMLHPLVNQFVSMGLSRDRVVIAIYAVLIAVMAILGVLLIPALIREVNSTLKEAPAYAASFNGMIDHLNNQLHQAFQHMTGKKAPDFSLPFRADRLLEGLVAKLPENLLNFAHLGLWALIIPFVGFFTLSQSTEWIDLLFDWTPSRYVESLLGFLAEIDAALGGYIRGQLLDAICVGLVTMTGLSIIGFNGAILLGCVTGFLNLIPFMAPIIGGSLALLIGYIQGLGPSALLAIFCLFISVRLIDDFIFTPFVVGRSVQLHPVIMMFAILAGFELGGILGMVFAVPAAAIVKVTISVAIHDRRNAVRLNERHILS